MVQKPRSLLMVFACCALLLSVSGIASAQPFGIGSPQAQRGPQHQVLASKNGRFVFGQVSDSSKDQFMLDTLTGRLWRIAETGEAGMFLRPVPYRTEKGKLSPVPDEIKASGAE